VSILYRASSGTEEVMSGGIATLLSLIREIVTSGTFDSPNTFSALIISNYFEKFGGCSVSGSPEAA
jgi:hypothetical protein